MFTITVERRPLNLFRFTTPVKLDFPSPVTNSELSTLMRTGQTHHQRPKLVLCTRRINVRLKLVVRALVNIEFVEFHKYGIVSYTRRKQEILDNVKDFLRIEGREEFGVVEFPCGTVFCVECFDLA